MVYRKPESTLPAMMPLQRNVISRLNQPSRPVLTAASMLQPPLTSTSQISDAQNMYARQGLQAGALKAAQPAQSTADLLRSYGLGVPTAPQAAARPAPLKTSRAATGLSGMLPASGTPEMAGLGAAGRTLMQLGGYQKEPMTLGQILGIGAEKGLEAMQARRDAIAAAKEKKAAAEAAAEEKEYQRQQDAKKFGLEESKAKAASRSDADKHYADAKRMGLTGSMADEYVLSQLSKTKTTKPSGFVSVYDKQGNFVENVREDSAEADDYANRGFRIVESTKIAGTKDEIGIGLSKADYSKRVLKVFDAKETINKLENVKGSFDERFFRIGGKVDLAVAKVADWGNFASDKQRDLIKRVADWQLDAWTQVNETIKAITGAQMSEPEAKRIMNQLPDPRDADFFKISSPTEYKAKLERALQEAKLAVARQQYFLKNGLEPVFEKTERTERNPRGYNVFYETDDGVLTLDGTKILMQKEASKLAEKYKDLPDDERRSAIKSDMQSLFGLGV
jgi:hypothetical protein